MQYLNGVKPEQIENADVDVYLRSNDEVIDAIQLCRTFLRDGKLWVDYIPALDRKYAVELPDDAFVSRNEEELNIGRYGVFIRPSTPAGQLARQLLAAKARL